MGGLEKLYSRSAFTYYILHSDAFKEHILPVTHLYYFT